MRVKCQEINELLPEYAARVLPSDMNVKIVSHLAVCPMCRADIALWIQLRGAIEAIDSAIEPQAMPVQPKPRALNPLEGTAKAIGYALRLTSETISFALSCAQ